MQNKIVVLEKTIVGHRPYKQLEFREPKFRELMEFGDPWFFVSAGENGGRVIEDNPVIQKYARSLLVEPDGKGGFMAGEDTVLDQLGIADTRKVKEAITGFFLDASRAAEASNTSAGNSSSTAASTPAPSTA